MSRPLSSINPQPCPDMHGWIYHRLTSENLQKSPFLSHLNALKRQWASDIIQIPDDWILENPVERPSTPGYKFKYISSVDILLRIRDMIAPLTLEAQQSRSLDFSGPEPDFLTAVAMGPETEPDTPMVETAAMDTRATFLRLVAFLHFREGHPDFELISMASRLGEVLQEFPGFFLRKPVYNGFADGENHCEPVAFGLLVRQYGSRPEGEWPFASPHDPPIFYQRQAVALAMRISETHPAVIVGMTDPPQSHPSEPSDSSPSNGNSEEPVLHRLAHQIQPSLKAVLKTWKMRQQQHGGPTDPPPWLILFGLITTADVVKIVAHYPSLHDAATHQDQEAPKRSADSDAPFYSCLIDEIPHYSGVCWEKYYLNDTDLQKGERWSGPVEDDAWIRARLRLFIALLTLLKNSRRISAIWDDIIWPREVLEAEDALEKRHAEWDIPTPNPSHEEGEDLSTMGYAAIWGATYDELVEETSDQEHDKEEENMSREKVLMWLRKSLLRGDKI